MTDTPLQGALWIGHVEVTDPDSYGRYATLAGPAITAHGGRFLARATRYVTLEGAERKRHVVAHFPSVEAAVECYNSPAYQEALGHARGAANRDLVVVELSPPAA
jgi:uncharacterized protein (DUF1330 family)